MKIYEGTNGLRGLITKLIEVHDFKKVVYEDDSTIDTNNVTFQLYVTDELFLRGQFTDTVQQGWCDLRTESLTCPCIGMSNSSDKRRWIIYKQSDLVAIGIDSNTSNRPDINIVIGEITNYETGKTEMGITTSCANNKISTYAVLTDGTTILSTPTRYEYQRKSVTCFAPVVSTDLNKGFSNVYHILSHTAQYNGTSTEGTVPTQVILLNGKKYLLSRFAFEIKD